MHKSALGFAGVAAALILTACSNTTSGRGTAAGTVAQLPAGSPTSPRANIAPSCASKCVKGSFEARALVMRAVPLILNDQNGRPYPLTGLSFPVPTSDTVYNALTPARQTVLAQAVARIHCDAVPAAPPNSTRAVCDSNAPHGVAYLLGPAILTRQDIASARAEPPTTASPKWGVSITLTTAGTHAWAQYTSAHNIGGSAIGGTATTCGTTSTPCADYVAFVANNVAISVPVTTDPITGATTWISGNFTQQSATAIARQITS